MSTLGARVRKARVARGMSVRELASKADCSPSMISQIESGRANPSVATLYEISSALEISLDSLFARVSGTTGRVPELVDPTGLRQVPGEHRSRGATHWSAVHTGGVELAPRGQPRTTPVQDESPSLLRKRNRQSIDLAHGVHWEQLVPVPEQGAQFLEVWYPPGGGALPNDHPARHNGREYGVIIEGTLSLQLGFEQFELGPGDSFAFDSTAPHRYWNAGTELVRGIWFVLDRWQSSRPRWDEDLSPHP